jgi:type I restriction enzyme S subunit
MTDHRTPLGRLAVAHYGKALKEADRDGRGSHVVYGSNGEVGRHTKALISFPTIVIGRKGSVGEVTYAPQGGWAIDTAYYLELLDPERVDLRYLYWALRDARLDRRVITTSIPGLNRDELYRTRILVPSAAEQRQIAATLDKADAIQHKRRASMQHINEFLRSAYVSLVGPESPSYSQWPELEIGSLAEQRDGSLRTGPFGSALRHGEFTDQGDVAVIGIDNVVENSFRWSERRFISRERYEKNFKRYMVRAGDVLVTIMGTTGRSAVAPEDLPVAISTKHLAVISVDRDRVYPEYLSHSIHCDPGVLGQIRVATRGAIMAGLNLGIIRRLRIRLPPVAQQRSFTAIVERIRAFQSKGAAALLMHEHLSESLAQAAFGGDPYQYLLPYRGVAQD